MLSEKDKEHLATLERQMTLVRDYTRGVAEGWHTGFYVWGEGGIGKSWTVLDELNRLNVPFHLTNSRLTGKGLFELLEERPEHVHVLEDVERLCRDSNAAGVLRSALWTTNPKKKQQHREREVTWVTGYERRRFGFTGGLILTMNMPLDDLPELRAVKTRIAHLHLAPSNAEIRALMKKIAHRGHEHGTGRLNAEQCLDVYDHVLARCDEAARNYDLRMLVNGFADRLQWEAGHAANHWHDLIEARMKEKVTTPSITRDGKIRSEREIALEIEAMTVSGAEKLRLWKERTTKSKSAYYARLTGK
jgi:hypothetical protein